MYWNLKKKENEGNIGMREKKVEEWDLRNAVTVMATQLEFRFAFLAADVTGLLW